MSIGSHGSGKGLSQETPMVELEQAWRDRETEAAVLAAGGQVAMALALRVYADDVRNHWDLLVSFGKLQLNHLRYKPSAGPDSGLGGVDPAALTNALDNATTGVHAWPSRPR